MKILRKLCMFLSLLITCLCLTSCLRTCSIPEQNIDLIKFSNDATVYVIDKDVTLLRPLDVKIVYQDFLRESDVFYQVYASRKGSGVAVSYYNIAELYYAFGKPYCGSSDERGVAESFTVPSGSTIHLERFWVDRFEQDSIIIGWYTDVEKISFISCSFKDNGKEKSFWIVSGTNTKIYRMPWEDESVPESRSFKPDKIKDLFPDGEFIF